MELENILDNSYFHHLNYFSQITLDTRGTNFSSSSSHGEWSMDRKNFGVEPVEIPEKSSNLFLTDQQLSKH
ncbi:hypothetical protein OUZ56_006171 [Daphnia magna]|uniref:Uncharacterized protein n=1 Tax=Daphnia magna TaxID=35525 RepID=A0ABQ9YUV9_9CRUS|nr:hypothetical protein OUZ56_006171 [Daphnia magna]